MLINRSDGVFGERRLCLLDNLLRWMINIIVVVVAAKLIVAPLIKLIAIRVQEATIRIDKEALWLVSAICLFRLLLIHFWMTLCLFSRVLFYGMLLLLVGKISARCCRFSVRVSVRCLVRGMIGITNLLMLLPSFLLSVWAWEVLLLIYKLWTALFYLVTWYWLIIVNKDCIRTWLNVIAARIIAIFVGLVARRLVLSLSAASVLRSCLSFVGWHLIEWACLVSTNRHRCFELVHLKN